MKRLRTASQHRRALARLTRMMRTAVKSRATRKLARLAVLISTYEHRRFPIP